MTSDPTLEYPVIEAIRNQSLGELRLRQQSFEHYSI